MKKLFYFICGLIIILSIIGWSVTNGWLYEIPSLFVIFAYIIGYFTYKEFTKDEGN